MSKSLLLFDIDGTLMITKGAGSRCLHRAGQRVFGESFAWTQITVGTLDPEIFAQLTEHNAIDNAAAQIDRFRAVYLLELAEELRRVAEDITVMPGIRSLIDQLRSRAQTDVVLGILTGNFTAAAELKLNAAGFDLGWFPVRVCAEDGRTRADLPRAAIQKASNLIGRSIEPGHTLIIGDTPRDIACAHANGCVALAVATGRYSTRELNEAGGNIVVESLADPAPLLDWLQKKG